MDGYKKRTSAGLAKFYIARLAWFLDGFKETYGAGNDVHGSRRPSTDNAGDVVLEIIQDVFASVLSEC